MLKTIHTFGSYLFLLSFLISCALSVLAILRKQEDLERISAWSFVTSFVLLALTYACGFGPEAALTGSSTQLARLAVRHHDMAKFVLTGMTLIGAAAGTVIYKYRRQRFPNWFLPNLLFLSLMVATFSIRSLVYIWQYANGQEGIGTRGEGRGAREEKAEQPRPLIENHHGRAIAASETPADQAPPQPSASP